MSNLFLQELLGQPEALYRLLDRYMTGSEPLNLNLVDGSTLFIGMGASYHAAMLAVHGLKHLALLPFRMWAVEATDLLYGFEPDPEPGTQIVYISQSGSSGEIVPLMERFKGKYPTVAITNNPDSPLGQGVDVVLPLFAGDEQTVASKTYINTLATCMLLCGYSSNDVNVTRVGIMNLIEQREQIEATLLATFPPDKIRTLYFLGHGSTAVTARQSAMMMHEWAKFPANHATIGAFRHGLIEVAQPDVGAVVFQSNTGDERVRESTNALVEELRRYGSPVVTVENGLLNTPSTSDLPAQVLRQAVLDIIPMQIFAESYARVRNIPPGFRHIRKVTTTV